MDSVKSKRLSTVIIRFSIPGFDLFEANMTGYEKALRYAPPLDPYLAGLVKLENVNWLPLIYCRHWSFCSSRKSRNPNAIPLKETRLEKFNLTYFCGNLTLIANYLKVIKWNLQMFSHSNVRIVVSVRLKDFHFFSISRLLQYAHYCARTFVNFIL